MPNRAVKTREYRHVLGSTSQKVLNGAKNVSVLIVN